MVPRFFSLAMVVGKPSSTKPVAVHEGIDNWRSEAAGVGADTLVTISGGADRASVGNPGGTSATFAP